MIGVDLQACGQVLSLSLCLGRALSPLTTESGMTILIAKMLSGLFHGFKYFDLSLLEIFSGPGNLLLPLLAPEPCLASWHFDNRTDDDLALARFNLNTFPHIQGDLGPNPFRNCDLELFPDFNSGSHGNFSRSD